MDGVRLPQLCTICASARGEQLLPDRSDATPPYRYDVLCPLCLDDLLDLFPIGPRTFAQREVWGRFVRTRTHTRQRRV